MFTIMEIPCNQLRLVRWGFVEHGYGAFGNGSPSVGFVGKMAHAQSFEVLSPCLVE